MYIDIIRLFSDNCFNCTQSAQKLLGEALCGYMSNPLFQATQCCHLDPPKCLATIADPFDSRANLDLSSQLSNPPPGGVGAVTPSAVKRRPFKTGIRDFASKSAFIFDGVHLSVFGHQAFDLTLVCSSNHRSPVRHTSTKHD